MWAALIGTIRGLLTRRGADAARPRRGGESAAQEAPLPTKADLRFTKVEGSLHSYRFVMAHQYLLGENITWDFEYSHAIEASSERPQASDQSQRRLRPCGGWRPAPSREHHLPPDLCHASDSTRSSVWSRSIVDDTASNSKMQADRPTH